MSSKTFDLKKFRAEKKLTQKQLAHVLGVEQSFLSNVERGVSPFPDNQIETLAHHYGDLSSYITNKNKSEKVDTTSREAAVLNDIIIPAAVFHIMQQQATSLEKKDAQMDNLITMLKGQLDMNKK